MRPQLEFSCPENWENMTPAEGGRFCGSCEKVVKDFTAMSDAEILDFIRKNSETQLCGRFTNLQIEKPFGDFRDHVIDLYRRAYTIPKKRYFVRAAMLCLTFSLLLLTGCGRRFHPQRLQGYAYMPHHPKPHSKHPIKGKF